MQSLTKVEEQIMQVIWDKQRCLVREIIQELGDPEIPHSTISSVVRILEKKVLLATKPMEKRMSTFRLLIKQITPRAA